MKIFLKNGHVIDKKTGKNGVMDVIIEDGKIVWVGNPGEVGSGSSYEEVETIISCEGKYVLPGLVDVHTHLREPGFEYKEDIASGTRSAAKGGFTSIACMPNTNPPLDNASLIEFVRSTAKEKGVVNVYPIGAISKGQLGKELAEIGEMKAAGAIAVSDDGRPVKSADLMKKALQYAAMFQMPVISHAEEMDLAQEGVMNEGYHSTVMGLKGIPSVAEDIMVSRDVMLAEYLKVPVHIAHVSTKGAIETIRQAKKRNVKVTCETCPHYFTITDESCLGFNTLAKVNPPLRTPEDREAVIEGLKDGTIDMIATDHAPHHADEKRVEFSQATNGMVGFETALALTLTKLVKPGLMSMEELVEKMCVNPAKLLGIPKGTLEVGADADVIVVDPNAEYVVEVEKFVSKSKNSPFNGFTVTGQVTHTIVGGKLVVQDGELV